MKIFVFGNGNLSFSKFQELYANTIITAITQNNPHFIVCDFRGTDILTIELLKNLTPNVTLLHMGEKSRYMPDKFKTYAEEWKIVGGFKNDSERDLYGIEQCTHFLAFDFNSDENRISGTLRNIRKCYSLNKAFLVSSPSKNS